MVIKSLVATKTLSSLVTLAILLTGFQPTYATEPQDSEPITPPESTVTVVPSPRIIGGSNASATDAPWQVALILASKGNDFDGQFCGGSIYSPRWIITAAHCVDNDPRPFNRSDLRILAGSTVLSDTSLSPSLLSVDRVVVHPGWNSDTKENDIALLRLSTPLVLSSTAQPILIPQNRPVPGSTAIITGWGDTTASSSNAVFPRDLKKASVEIGEDSYCGTRYFYYFDDLMVCAFDNPYYDIDTCQADSGGPLAVLVSGRWELHGITSFGRGCAQYSYPGVYAETFHYATWIRQNADIQFAQAPTPTITGNLRRGQVLTANRGSWSESPRLTYQWLQNGQAISGQTSATITLAAAQVGKRISVAVTGTKQGYVDTTRTSAQTAAITGFTQTNPGTQTISGDLLQNSTLTAVRAGWPEDATLSYVWYRGTTAISGARSATYRLTSADIGQRIKVMVTGSRVGYNPLVIESNPTALVRGIFVSPPTPTISGTRVVGSVLTAIPGTWSPTPNSYNYQWLRSGVAITGATTATYRLTPADWNELISVTVTALRTNYRSGSANSDSNPSIILKPFAESPIPTISPTGQPARDQVLTANPGDWSDSANLSYQWFESGIAISGQTSPTITLAADQVGKRISVAVTGTQDGFVTTTRTSAQTAAASGYTQPDPGIQVISGDPNQYTELTALNGDWNGATLSHVWYRGNAVIADASSDTYTLTAADIGFAIKVSVTGTRWGYNPLTVTSQLTSRVRGVFLNPPTPTISGTPAVDSTLAASAGSWNPSANLTYQWLRSGGPITGATTPTYRLTSDDRGHQISVKVIGQRTQYLTTEVTSDQTPAIKIPYELTAAPTVESDGGITVGATLTAYPGTWNPGGSIFTYQWLADGVPIDGATSSTIVLAPELMGKRISIEVTGSQAEYVPTTRVLNLGPVAGLTQTNPGTQTISGDLLQNSTLTAVRSGWPEDATFSYVWYRGNTTISGARSSTYRLTSADIGQTIKVRVTGSRTGYTPLAITSAPTSVVRGIFVSPPTPTISGSRVVGSTLTVQPGTWTPAPTSPLRYQWLRAGVAISGATASTYRLVGADLNQRISVTVTAVRTGYRNGQASSSQSSAIAPGVMTSSTPTITGSMLKSGSLTANPGTWSPAPRFSYQWFRNGATISGATSRTYSLQQADWGKRISVRVTGTVTGYTTVAKTSAARSDWVTARSTYRTFSGYEMYSSCIAWGWESEWPSDWQNIGDTFAPCSYDGWHAPFVRLYSDGNFDGKQTTIHAGKTLPTDTARYRITFTYWTGESGFTFYATNLDVDEFSNVFVFPNTSSAVSSITSSWVSVKDVGELDYIITAPDNLWGSIYISSLTVEVERFQ
jgi:secreted trypsin-like serine protease